jgi:hypothetical protein
MVKKRRERERCVCKTDQLFILDSSKDKETCLFSGTYAGFRANSVQHNEKYTLRKEQK